MKKPEEIKKGLECCNTYNYCQQCPYDKAYGSWACTVERNADALAYIQQLEKKAALYDEGVADALQLERERDAAVKDMQMIVETDNCKCETCGHCAFDEEDEPRICTNCDAETYSNWRWRGAPVEE